MIEVFAIYDKEDKLVVCFPTRNDAENYGKVVLGNENGWDYSIKKMFLYETKQLQYSYTQPFPLTQQFPYTPPITVPSPPYTNPNPIWCEGVK